MNDGATTLVNGPLGRDAAKTASTTTYFLPDPTGNAIGEQVGSNRYYFLENRIGSVTAVITGSGTVKDRFSYSSYGQITSSSGSVYDPIRFAGGYYEAASGLTKFGTRWNDSATGRWTQENPIGGTIADPSTVNGYAYAVDNPISHADPTGRSSTTTPFGAVAKTFEVVGSGVACGAALGGVGAAVAGLPGAIVGFGIGLFGCGPAAKKHTWVAT